MKRTIELIGTACLALAAILHSAPAKADKAYDACMEHPDGTNPAWGKCGQDWVDREEAKLNATWKKLYAGLSGKTKTDLLNEQRLWNAYKEASCMFHANGDYGREGEVVDFPTCRAGVIAERTKELEAIGKAIN
jgi:uncharacterized protein YecT (DUF1311 family)